MRRGLASVLVCAALLAPAALAEPIDDCGRVYSFMGCHFFVPFSNAGSYVLDISSVPDSLRYAPVRVLGDGVYCHAVCQGTAFPGCIIDCHLSLCPPRDLGCGILQNVGDGCWLWSSTIYGELLAVPDGHASGDTVRASGFADYTCASVCNTGTGCLMFSTYGDCPDTTSSVLTTTWGQLKTWPRE